MRPLATPSIVTSAHGRTSRTSTAGRAGMAVSAATVAAGEGVRAASMSGFDAAAESGSGGGGVAARVVFAAGGLVGEAVAGASVRATAGGRVFAGSGMIVRGAGVPSHRH